MLKDKIVFITGASSGIGMACAEYFAKAGAKLLLCARRQALLNELSSRLQNQYGVEVYSFPLDVSLSTEVKATLERLPETWKEIQVLVNNAGLAAGLDSIQEGDLQDWEAMINTNFKGLLYVTKMVLPEMLNRNSGHIINIGSIAGHQVYPKGAVYCATKFAVNALTQGLKMDLLGTDIRVTTIDPGAVETHFSHVRFKNDMEKAAAVYEGMVPLKPEDVADAVLYCATRPHHVNISEVVLMPTAQASATMIARNNRQNSD